MPLFREVTKDGLTREEELLGYIEQLERTIDDSRQEIDRLRQRINTFSKAGKILSGEAGKMEMVCELLPHGYALYRQPNGVGGHTYFSDEIGGGVMVWDTSLTYSSTLLTAVGAEAFRIAQERAKDALPPA